MNASITMSEQVESQALVALLLGKTEPSVSVFPESTSTATAGDAVSPVLEDEAARFREKILRRYEAPFQTGWDHGGLNE